MKKRKKIKRKGVWQKFWKSVFNRMPISWLFYGSLILPNFIKKSLRKYLPKKALLTGPALNWFTLSVLAWQTLRQHGFRVLLSRIRQYFNMRRSLKTEIKSRPFDAAKQKPHIPNPKNFTVLFIAGDEEILSKRYRVYNIIEQLQLLGIKAEYLPASQIENQLEKICQFDLWVFFRLGMSPIIQRLLEVARQLNIICILDFDDYVFEPEIIKFIDPVKKMIPLEHKVYIQGLKDYQKIFQSFYYLILSTNFLAKIAERKGKKSFVIRNALNQTQIQESKRALAERLEKIKKDKTINIGYFSGTKTHQKDFEEVAPALLKILKEYPEVNLYLGGYLELNERFKPFQEQIKKLPFTPWQKLPYQLAKIDINLAPLELNNPFNEAKSDLKYFEAALLKIPTIASSTQTFKEAIKNGQNGFLAKDKKEWYFYLRKLIKDNNLREKMAEKAFRHTLIHYFPSNQANQTKKIYQNIISDFQKKYNLNQKKLKISFITTPPALGSGGHRNIYRAARYLTKFGHEVKIYILSDDPFRGFFQNTFEVKEFILANFLNPSAEIILGTKKIEPCDALLATEWRTVEKVIQNKDKAEGFFYFVQDFEPYFHPMGDEYIKTENTYKLGLTHITSGPWPTKILRERYKARADYFRFPVRTNIYYPRENHGKKKRLVIFFARPEMPRRCFSLGVKALEIFHRKNPNLKIALFGSGNIDAYSIPFPFKNYGILTDEQLAELYSKAMIGLAFSTTNPSLVPFEMMACKLPVVDLDYNDNDVNYSSRKNLILAKPEAVEIAQGIEKLIKNKDLREKIAENGYQFVKSFPNEEESSKRIEKLILKEFTK